VQAFWDVVFSDALALVAFVAPMLLFSFVASAIGAGVGADRSVPWVRGPFLRAVGGGMFAGTIVAILVSMVVEMGLKAEGLPYGAQVLREHATIQLWLFSPGAALIAGYFAARWLTSTPSKATGPRGRYTLQQLFLAQFIAGLLLGWWVFTRRDQISERRADLYWQNRENAAKAAFEPYGWRVSIFREFAEIDLTTDWHPSQQPAGDDSLGLVARDGSVGSLVVSSDAVTDAGLEHLAEADTIRELFIASDQVTDEGIRRLSALPRLRYLGIRSPNITGASLEHLAKVKSLRYVTLSTTQISAEEQAAFHLARPNVQLRFNERGR
jgi:hypothetical protein